MNEKYNYNLSGSDRKPLVEAISQILDQPAIYQGAPRFSYIIGDYTVDRNGALSYSNSIHPDFAAVLVEDLRSRGFVAERIAAENGNILEAIQSDDTPTRLTVEIPSAGFTPETLENLKKIVASKAVLLKQSLETDNLPVKELDGKIVFPWFTLHGLEGEADAYNRLAVALCNMAKNQKRVTATEKPVENAKFDMRLFLVRLGFIGDEYKTARRILMRNLSGNGSWKSGHKPECSAEDTANNESVEFVTTPADEGAEESAENKEEGGEEYGK